jgi:beta-N-acetylhexosaminidase
MLISVISCNGSETSLSPEMRHRLCLAFCLLWVVFSTFLPIPADAQVSLRSKIGQMIMVTVTGDSVEESSPSMDTLKSDLSEGLLGGLVMYVWSGNLNIPSQIAHFTGELQNRSTVPLLLAIDQEGGKVARLSASNGFASTPTAYSMGTVVNQESNTRSVAATMAGWFVQTGLTMNLTPVVDVNVNPASPAIGALERSFSADPLTVAAHARWFIEEFGAKGVVTTLKHFPGHGSAVGDSHLGFTDVTSTWSPMELQPYTNLLGGHLVDAVMTAHVFNANLDSIYPATLSHATISGLLRGQLGYGGVVVSDAMGMKAISSLFGDDQAIELAVNAGVDMLLYTRNLDSTGKSLARHIVDFIARRVQEGGITQARIDESYSRIMALKTKYVTSVRAPISERLPQGIELTNYPNPFNASTRVSASLPRACAVEITIYDLLGRVVSRIAAGDLQPGRHEFLWSAPAASGTYFCRLQARAVEDPSWSVTRVATLVVVR